MCYGTVCNKVTGQTLSVNFGPWMYVCLHFHATYDILLKMPGDVSKKRQACLAKHLNCQWKNSAGPVDLHCDILQTLCISIRTGAVV